MNLRPPMRKSVSIFLCSVIILLELVEKRTFGFSKESPQEEESKRFSFFYQVEEGMFKKLLHDRGNSFRILQFTCAQALDKKYTYSAYQEKSKEYTSYFIWPVKLRHKVSKEQVFNEEGSV